LKVKIDVNNRSGGSELNLQERSPASPAKFECGFAGRFHRAAETNCRRPPPRRPFLNRRKSPLTLPSNARTRFHDRQKNLRFPRNLAAATCIHTSEAAFAAPQIREILQFYPAQTYNYS